MSKLIVTVSSLAILAVAVCLSGCGEKKKPASKPTSGKAPTAKQDEHAGHKHAPTKVEKAIAELPEAERAAAQKQKTCPVSGSALGSMGMPYKVTVKGRDVYLCCKGCEGAILEDPDKYLAKLKE